MRPNATWLEARHPALSLICEVEGRSAQGASVRVERVDGGRSVDGPDE